SGVAQARADPQPVDLLFRLDQPQPQVIGIHRYHLEARLQLLQLPVCQRADQPDAPGAAACELLDRERNAAVLAPAHVHALRDAPGQRQVVVPLDVHRHALARPEHDERLDGPGPAGHPLGGVAGALVGDDQQVIDLALLHERPERLVAPCVLRVREAGKFRLHARGQSFFAPEALTIGAQRLTSEATRAVTSAAVSLFGPMPSGRSRSRVSGASSALRTSAFSRSTMSAGMPAGPESENQIVAIRSL